MTMKLDFDVCIMKQALDLARQGQGRVEPNPMVGAIVVHDGKIVGQGFHQSFGGPHAEIEALQQAGERARGATLYVTLEPCCHHGKTPPCTDAIILAGIKEVVACGVDPNPQVAGKGFSRLAEAGIESRIGVLQREAESLNAPFFKLMQTEKPYVIAKWAMTLDGRIATASGVSKWISGDQSRQLVHALRGRVDGILVGIGTVRLDDPLLTARPQGARLATRIVLDSHLKLPLMSQLVLTAREYPTLIFHTLDDVQRRQLLMEKGCDCCQLDEVGRRHQVDLILKELGRRKMTNLLVEGGSTVLGAFFDAEAVDEVWVFIAPKWIGSSTSFGPIMGQGSDAISHLGQLNSMTVEQVGEDILIRGRCLYQTKTSI